MHAVETKKKQDEICILETNGECQKLDTAKYY